MLWFEDLKRKLIRGAGRLIRPKIVVEFLSNIFRPENAPLNNLTQIAVSLAGFSGQRSRYTHYSLITPPGSFQAYFFFSISPEEVSSGGDKEKEDSGRINAKWGFILII